MKTTPKDFFVHLGAIITLYISTVSLLSLAFKIINVAFPPVGSITNGFSYSQSISWPVATLIIVFPIFLLLSWLLQKDYVLMPEKRGLGIRRWLVYITLFLAGIAMATDLVIVLYTFLDGENVTAGFLLKALAVLIVAGAIFYHYISDLRETLTAGKRKIAAVASGVVILALIVAGFAIIGSPRSQRLARIDAQKVTDLQNIQWQIVNYWQQKEALPQTLTGLEDPISGYVVPRDPDTGERYGYRPLEGASFELCAVFNLSDEGSDPKSIGMMRPEMIGTIQGNQSWAHNTGSNCFVRTIDPDLYPSRVPGGGIPVPKTP